MSRFFLKAFLLFVKILVSLSIFLSYFGIETDRFDGLIKNKANEVNQYVKLEFRKTKIYLNPAEFNFVVKFWQLLKWTYRAVCVQDFFHQLGNIILFELHFLNK